MEELESYRSARRFHWLHHWASSPRPPRKASETGRRLIRGAGAGAGDR
jgi:hypothetical protein